MKPDRNGFYRKPFEFERKLEKTIFVSIEFIDKFVIEEFVGYLGTGL